MRIKVIIAALLFSAAWGTTAMAVGATTGEVNLYSYRQPFLMDPLLEAFTEETGIKVNMVYLKKGMLERLKSEGANSPADLVLTADIGNLRIQASDLGVRHFLRPLPRWAMARMLTRNSGR